LIMFVCVHIQLSSSCISTSKNRFKTKPVPIGTGFVVLNKKTNLKI
jgi:hypothetical protein